MIKIIAEKTTGISGIGKLKRTSTSLFVQFYEDGELRHSISCVHGEAQAQIDDYLERADVPMTKCALSVRENGRRVYDDYGGSAAGNIPDWFGKVEQGGLNND